MDGQLIRPDAVAAYCDERALPARHRSVFEHLVPEAAPTGIINRFNLTRCANELGFGLSAGRRTLGRILQSLHDDFGVVQYTPATDRPTGAGRVEIPDYAVFLKEQVGGHAARVARVARSSRASRAFLGSADPAASRARSGVLPSEELFLAGLQCDDEASQPASQGSLRDWTDEELDGLVAPLVELCRRTGCVGINGRGGLLSALQPFNRAQVEHAVRTVCLELRTANTLRKPFGYLISEARKANPELFPVDPPGRPLAAQAPSIKSAVPFTPAPPEHVAATVSSARDALRSRAHRSAGPA